MKVLHLLDTVDRGGAEMLALDVCRSARRHGIEMIFATAQGGELEADFRASGADFVRLNRKLPIDFIEIFNLRRLIKKRGIEIAHAHQAVDALHLYLATLNMPVKKILTFHGFIADAKNLRSLRFLIPRMDANIVVSQGLKTWLAKKDGLDVGSFRVLYNGTDVERLAPTGKSLKKELKLEQSAPLIGMIGNFYRDPRKDQMTLCRALPKVFAEVKNAHCVFAGKVESGAEAKLRDCIEFCEASGIADRVHFLGVRDDIPDVLDALDLFVFSSLQEGLPIAMTEAMLVGVPLIVSNIEPLLEASVNGEYAEVFPVGDAETLSAKIIELLRNARLRQGLADRAKNYASRQFSISGHLEQLKALYESL